MRAIPARSLVATLALCLSAVACSDDGRELRQPGPDQTLSIVTTSSTVVDGSVIDTGSEPTDAPVLGFDVILPWSNEQDIAEVYTCDGADTSPAFSFVGVPPEAAELAVTMIDPDSDPPGYVHWVVAGIDPSTVSVAEGQVPGGSVQATNDFGDAAYGGPCPPEGQQHRYIVTAYALVSPSGVTAGMSGDEAITLIEEAAHLGVAEVTGLYER